MGSRVTSDPGIDLERELAAQGLRYVGGMDEVGRGALAGPASVGLVVFDAAALDSADPSVWHGVRDSKALTAKRREALAPAIDSWAAAGTVGHAQPFEIDRLGISAALRLAGLRALAQAASSGISVDGLILDGSYNWLRTEPVLGQETDPWGVPAVVRTLVKADAHCVSVAAASIAAKVERDAIMRNYAGEYPAYGWESNKGYGSAVHRAAIVEHGATPLHRVSWNLGI